MQDLTKNTNAKTIDIKPSEAATKQSRWLTKNRFWNLAFLFLVPVQIFIAAVFWSGWLLLIPLATTVAIFNFVSVDTSAADNREPHAVKAIKSAGYIWFSSFLAFILAGNSILSLFGLQVGQFGFGESVFFIFLIPVSILCYYDIPLASCVEARDSSKFRSRGINMFNHSSTAAHNRLSPSQSWRPENVFSKR